MSRPKGSKNFKPRARVTDEQLLLARGLPPEKRDEIVGDLIVKKAKETGYKQRTDKRVLANLIRDIGEEVIDPNLGWTRVEALIRRLYNEAMAGKIQAAELLLDRGWGKVPTPVDVDISGEVRKLTINAGLTWDVISADPLLRQLIELSGVTPDEAVLLEGEYAELGSAGPALPEGESRTDSPQSGGDSGSERNNRD